MRVEIKRTYQKKETLGQLDIFNNELSIFTCKTIELPNLSNQKSISCIPEGDYTVTKIVSPTKGRCFLLHNVPNRTAVEIHIGNYATGKKVDTEGCILPGLVIEDMNKDGELDVSNSTTAMNILLQYLPDQFLLSIKS